MFAHPRERRYVRIAVGYFSTEVAELFHQVHRRRLADVIDILFIGNAKNEDVASLDRFALSVEGARDLGYDIIRHRRIDLARELDEAGVHAVFARFPGKVKRVDRNAVATDPGTGI